MQDREYTSMPMSSSFFLEDLVVGDLGSVAFEIIDVSPGACAVVGDVGAPLAAEAVLLRGMVVGSR